MTDQTPAPQTIDLDNPATVCVFTADGTPFYSVQGMARMLTLDLARRALNLRPGSTDADRAYLLGQTDLVQFILAQADALRSVYQSHNINNVEDLMRFANGNIVPGPEDGDEPRPFGRHG